MSRRLVLLAGIALLVAGAAAAGLAAARGPDPNAVPTATQVEERTMSPFCVGLTLAACPSSEAVQLRATIAEMVADHKTNRQIDDFLLASYPATIVGAPRNPLAWLIPAGAVIAALAAIIGVVATRGPGRSQEPPAPLSPADAARLADDLRRFAQGLSE